MSQLLGKAGLQEIGLGLYPDYKNDSAPLFVDGANVSFEGGRALPAPGQKLVLATGLRSPIIGIHSQFAWGKDHIFIAVAEGIYDWNGEELSLVWDAPVAQVQFASFGNFTMAADGGKLLVKKQELDVFERIEDSFDCSFVTVFSPYVLIYGSRTIGWCHNDDVDQFTPDVENDARSLPIRDMDSDFVAVLPHSSGSYGLTTNGLFNTQYVGDPLFFGCKRLMKDVGAVGPQAVEIVGTVLYGVGVSGVWRTDGVSFTYIDNPVLREEFFKRLNPARTREITLWHDTINERLVLSFVDKDNEWRALFYSFKYTNWSILNIGFSAIDRGRNSKLALLGSERGNVFGQTNDSVAQNQVLGLGLRLTSTLEVVLPFDYGGFDQFGFEGFRQVNPRSGLPSTPDVLIQYTKNGQTYEFTIIQETDAGIFLETKDLDFGTTEEKYVDEIVVKLSDAGIAGDLRLRYALKDRMNDPVVWSDPIALADADGPVFIRETSRYFRFRLEDTFLRKRWQLTGLEPYGEVMGGRR